MQKRHECSPLKNKKNIIGEKINYYRLEKNISAQKLSDKLMTMGVDVHRQAIYAIEAGKRTITDYEICFFAEALGVTTNDLLEDFVKYIKNEYK